MHLLAWDVLKGEKKYGGLGFKDLYYQNVAFIMKLCWGLLTRPNDLWVKCLKTKYGCGDGKYPKVEKKYQQSAVWKAIISVWDKFMDGVRCKIGTGANTNAWMEKWLPLDRPLLEYVDKNFHRINPEATVNQFLTPTGSWNIVKWQEFLPTWITQKIQLFQPPRGLCVDGFYWKASTDGGFNVKSAYSMIYNRPNHRPDYVWQNIWRWDIPERAKFFMWQVFHERVLVNSLRAKRVPSTSPICPFECMNEESIIHTLRDCEIARSSWIQLINPLYISVFFSCDLQVWLRWNLKNEPASRRFNRWPWSRIFGLMCWTLWKNRCRMVFDGGSDSAQTLVNRCKFQLMEEVENGKYKHYIFRTQDRSNGRWFSPPTGYVRVDVDGSMSSQHQATTGGLIRDERGHWVKGFQQKIGYAPSTTAEVIAIGTGLQLCKMLNLSKIKLFSDSIEVIQLLLTDCGHDHPLRGEIGDIRSLISSDWDLEIVHVNREALRSADCLARTAHEAQS